jgi:hypothetical protein
VENCACKQHGSVSPNADKREGVLEMRAHLKFAFKRWSHELAGAPEAVWVTYTFGKEDASQPTASASNPHHGSIHLEVVLVSIHLRMRMDDKFELQTLQHFKTYTSKFTLFSMHKY